MIPVGNIIAQRVREVVQDGELGRDYTFDARRDKNLELRRNYKVDDAKMIEILLSLEGSDYVKGEYSISKDHPDDTVHVFNKTVSLMPKYVEDASYKDIDIYIKVTWPDGEEPMFIISFHESEE